MNIQVNKNHAKNNIYTYIKKIGKKFSKQQNDRNEQNLKVFFSLKAENQVKNFKCGAAFFF